MTSIPAKIDLTLNRSPATSDLPTLMNQFTHFPQQLITPCFMAWTAIASLAGLVSAQEPPKPLAISPNGPIDVVVSLDRPMNPGMAAKLVGSSISFKAKKSPQTGSIRIAGAKLDDDGRTLHLATDPHTLDATFTIHPTVGPTWDYALSGIEASWIEAEAAPESPPSWTGRLPDFDLDESLSSIKGSRFHEQLLERLQKPGQLTLATQAAFPKGQLRVQFDSSLPIEEILLGNEAFQAEEGGKPVLSHSLNVASTGDPQFLLVRIRTEAGEKPPSLKLRFGDGDAPATSKLSPENSLLPWVPLPPATAGAVTTQPSEAALAGGDASRGEVTFHGDQAQCGRCHRVRGKGGEIGPDLSEVAKKGITSIYRSIAAPSESIDPQYVAFTVSMKDGRVVSGVVRAEGPDDIIVTDTNAKTIKIPRKEIEQIRPASASIMPVGLASALGEERVKDIIAFLLNAGGK